MRLLLLAAMERCCGLIDRLDGRVPLGPLRRLGCPSGLAYWSYLLEERWGLTPPPPTAPRGTPEGR